MGSFDVKNRGRKVYRTVVLIKEHREKVETSSVAAVPKFYHTVIKPGG